MDEQQKDNQDLVVGDDGSMNKDAQGVSQETDSPSSNIEVKVDDEASSEPSVDETTPPPEENITTKEEEPAEEAVNFIAGAKSNDDSKEDENSQDSKTESSDEVVKAPESSDTVKPTEDNPGVVAESSVVTETIQEVTDISHNDDASTQSVAATVEPGQEGMSNNEQNSPHEHRNNKKLAVIVIIFVALMLSGAAVFAFISAQSNTEETSPESSTQTSQTEGLPVNEVTPANQDDIDSTINELDETIDSLDSNELGEETINDSTLGL